MEFISHQYSSAPKMLGGKNTIYKRKNTTCMGTGSHRMTAQTCERIGSSHSVTRALAAFSVYNYIWALAWTKADSNSYLNDQCPNWTSVQPHNTRRKVKQVNFKTMNHSDTVIIFISKLYFEDATCIYADALWLKDAESPNFEIKKK
jgi:hypothetical protein